MIAYLCSVAAFVAGYALSSRLKVWTWQWEYDRGFAHGRRSERADALREAADTARPFVMRTSGDGSREQPFTREMHHAQCAALHGRACDCELLIAKGGRR